MRAYVHSRDAEVKRHAGIYYCFCSVIDYICAVVVARVERSFILFPPPPPPPAPVAASYCAS